MQRLITFLIRHYAVFMFLVLESVAMVMVVQNNSFHKAGFINSMSDFSGSVNESWSNVIDYLNLGAVNDELARENAELRARQKHSFEKTDRNIFTWNDTLYRVNFQYIEAKVIHSSINKKNNYIMINKGHNQGVVRDMGVISPAGVVGIVKETSENYALILPVIHTQGRIASKIQKNSQKGMVSWDGKNYREGTMKYVPAHVNIQKGDTIITSGHSLTFPEGLMVGTVHSFTINQSDNFYNIKMNFMEDFNRLEYVYIIRNLLSDEQRNLLLNQEDE